jgi:hypothetical protein
MLWAKRRRRTALGADYIGGSRPLKSPKIGLPGDGGNTAFGQDADFRVLWAPLAAL